MIVPNQGNNACYKIASVNCSDVVVYCSCVHLLFQVSLLSLPPKFESINNCAAKMSDSSPHSQLSTSLVVSIIIGVILCFCIILALFLKIWNTVRRHKKSKHDGDPARVSSRARPSMNIALQRSQNAQLVDSRAAAGYEGAYRGHWSRMGEFQWNANAKEQCHLTLCWSLFFEQLYYFEGLLSLLRHNNSRLRQSIHHGF